MPKKSAKKIVKRAAVKKSHHVHGMDHDFILIAGGGFVLLILILIVLYR
jgi:hypothetical protein